MPAYIKVEQGSEAWFAARCGLITASRVSDVLAKTKSGPAASRRNYAAELLVERITGEPTPGGFVSEAMRWGTEQEPRARAEYEIATGNEVEQVGFAIHDEHVWLGASPDGLVGLDGAIEIKCMNTANHLYTIESGSVPKKYYDQIQTVLYVTDRAWCDYVSYDPRVRYKGLELFVKRINRDPSWIKETIPELEAFEREVHERVLYFEQLAREREE